MVFTRYDLVDFTLIPIWIRIFILDPNPNPPKH